MIPNNLNSLVNDIAYIFIGFIIAFLTAYFQSKGKSKAELPEKEHYKDREHAAEIIRSAISDMKNELNDLKVNEFKGKLGNSKRAKTRVINYIEDIRLSGDDELCNWLYELINAPAILSSSNSNDKKERIDSQSTAYIIKLKNYYFDLINKAMDRLIFLQKNPLKK